MRRFTRSAISKHEWRRSRRAGKGQRLFACGLLAAVCWSAVATVSQASPTDLAPRSYEDSVGTIITALAQKVSAAGPLQIGLTTQFEGKQLGTWQIGFKGDESYARHTDHAYTLYSDGEYFYEIERKTLLAQDSVEAGDRWDFDLRFYLAYANLRPQQFLSRAAHMRDLGQVQIDGRNYTHLRADPAQDERTRLNALAPGGRARPVLNLYYDVERKAIAEIRIEYFTGMQARARVTAWDGFGTESLWPKRIEGARWFHRSNGEVEQVTPTMTVSILSFDRQEPVQLASIRDRHDQVAYYLGVVRDLRTPPAYQSLVDERPNDLTAKAILAQSALRSGRPAAGLAAWASVRDAVAEQPGEVDRLNAALDRLLIDALAGSSLPGERAAVAQVILLLDQSLDEKQWGRFAGKIFVAYRDVINTPAAAEVLAEKEPALITRWVKQGQRDVLVGLIKLSNQNQRLAAMINPVLAAQAALPHENIDGSEPFKVISASIRAGDRARALGYMDNLAWEAGAPRSDIDAVQTLRSVVEAADTAAQGSAEGAVTLATAFAAAVDQESSGKECRRFARDIALPRAAYSLTRATRWSEEAVAPEELVAATAAIPHAQAFWAEVVELMLRWSSPSVQASNHQIECVVSVARGVETTFADAGYESRILARIGRSRIVNLRVYSHAKRIDLLNQAFATAQSDVDRADAIDGLVRVYASMGEYDAAAQVMDQLKNSVGEAHQVELAKLSEFLATNEQTRARLRADQAEALKLDELRGRIAYMKEERREAELIGKPPEYLSGLDQRIASVEQQLETAKSASRN